MQILFHWLILFPLFAQRQLPPEVNIRTTAPLVLVPTTVTDRDGKPFPGLGEEDFALTDGASLAKHHIEVTTQPISVILCVQTNRHSGPALAKIVKVGSMILPLIAGEGGAAAVVTYSDRVTVRQDFTADSGLLTAAFQAMRPDGEGARMLDAVDKSLRMLDGRNPRQRKVLIVAGEAKDRASESKMDEAPRAAIRSNVTIYPVSFPVYLTAFTSKGDERFGKKRNPDDKEDERVKVYEAGGGMSLITALVELSRMGKENTAEALAKSTGGERLSFVRLRALEEVMWGIAILG